MSRYMSGVRLLPGALLAILGWAGPGWATYGGGACHRCAPAPVVQTTTVVLAPQCQTVNETVYETAYENQQFTAMETRYRTALQTEQYTVMKPVSETSYVQRKYTVM